MLLEGETRHEFVGLRLEIDARHAPLCGGVEEGQPRARHQVVHQRGDEHGLARTGEPGDAELYRRRDQARGEIAHAAKGIAGGLAIGGDGHESCMSLAL